MNRRHFVTALVLFVVACGGRPRQLAVQPLSPERQARCTAINDSIFANVEAEQLPEAKIAGQRPSIRVPQSSVRSHTPVHFFYLVRADGTSDTSTVRIDGTESAAFRDDVVRYARRNQMAPAQIDGCQVWSKVSVTITPLGIERVRRRP
jgi:hypothetical protein